MPLRSRHSKIPDFRNYSTVSIITSCSNNHRSSQMNIAVEYTAPMKCSFLVHGGSYGHLEIIVSIKQPNCRTNIIMFISEIKVLEFMDILAEVICFSDQNSLKLLMPFAKFWQKNLKKTLNKIISTQLSLHHAVRTLYFVYFSSFLVIILQTVLHWKSKFLKEF